MSVQRIVEDSPAIELQAEAQHTSGEVETPVTTKFNSLISQDYEWNLKMLSFFGVLAAFCAKI